MKFNFKQIEFKTDFGVQIPFDFDFILAFNSFFRLFFHFLSLFASKVVQNTFSVPIQIFKKKIAVFSAQIPKNLLFQ